MNWTPPLTRAGKPCTRCRPDRPCHPSHARPGRRSVFDPDSKKRFLGALRLGISIKRACAIAGWHETTYYKWKAAYEKGECPDGMFQFFEVEVPEAQEVLYAKAMAAIQDGFSPKVDPDKRAAHGLKVVQTFFGKETDPAPQEHRVTGDLKALLEKHRKKRKEAERGRGTDGSG